MKSMNDRKQNHKQKMDKIRRDCYNHTEKALSLFSDGKADKWVEILQHSDWSEIRKLCLGNCKVCDLNVKYLVALNFPNLKILEFYANLMTASGVNKLVSKEWPKLQVINFTGNSIGNQGLKTFLSSLQYFPSLIKFSAQKNLITGIGLKPLIDMRLGQIKYLYLSLNQIGSKGSKILIKVKLQILQELQLSYCELNDQGSKHLNKGLWPNLKKIRLNGNNINLTGLKALTNNNWKQLSEMIIWEIQPIQLLCIGRNDWSVGTQIVRQMKNYNFCREIREILKMRSWK